MEEARLLVFFLSQPIAQEGSTCKEVKISLSLKLAQSSKAVRPVNETLEGGNSTSEGTVQYGKGTFNGETRTELQHTSMEQAMTRTLRGGDLQRRGYADMPSTVAE